MILRSISPSDFSQWQPLWDGYNKFYKRVIPTAVTQMTWSRFFDSYEPVNALVAERDRRLVGLVHYLFHRNTAALGPVCYLQDLFTEEASRGCGVGRSLIEGVYAKARDAGASYVYWLTHETNLTARGLYKQVAEHSGFIMYGKAISSETR